MGSKTISSGIRKVISEKLKACSRVDLQKLCQLLANYERRIRRMEECLGYPTAVNEDKKNPRKKGNNAKKK